MPSKDSLHELILDEVILRNALEEEMELETLKSIVYVLTIIYVLIALAFIFTP